MLIESLIHLLMGYGKPDFVIMTAYEINPHLYQTEQYLRSPSESNFSNLNEKYIQKHPRHKISQSRLFKRDEK